MSRGKKAFKVMGFVMLGILAVAAFGFVTMFLWNWLVPELFHGPELTFWQALGLLILSKILFSGFGKGKGSHHSGSWKPYWKERLNRMTPEDQERFKEKMIRLKYKMEDKWCRPAREGKESSTTSSGDANV